MNTIGQKTSKITMENIDNFRELRTIEILDKCVLNVEK
jgi:hypothetical protein